MTTPATPLLLVTTGILFALYPILRPYSVEVGEAGAEAFASPLWIVAHLAAMFGFITLALFVRQVRTGTLADTTTLVGVALILPYYGAETFALHVVGRDAVDTGRTGLLDLADPIRYGVIQATMFGAGLILIAVAAVVLAVHTGGVPAAVFAAGFVLFLPQFFAPPWVRIAHGVLILVGAVMLARRISSGADLTPAEAAPHSRADGLSDAV
ncbi:hypothetical protein HQ305_08545 [Rhodococcus sp. BP-149]|uniref:hypothetical protein n=1 Tax=unclassified Rhodococcus (in: high G+C Gram-positive bacteria) TaxID=192944 RepID=UPI001C9AA5C4|nr:MULTISPECIES: hypothetical protein [unclassified Rhodococcus (in: high G+C Gram-positive bacteria)]MBY6686130.1 hypothetical protein [Rhodococcus sp. BP-288]MBY6693780.1 hypothetical protein [Rhodococcus sp. BP-188]MBY6699623.1 hypothetical protein [Rhodococcus sp. BP-285]MBY6704032.1 hypothetical protein [Rhodococcus sp. BP-283]MBY6710819.1 hypothetical protein [Rhodococcus sp. BP-160]